MNIKKNTVCENRSQNIERRERRPRQRVRWLPGNGHPSIRSWKRLALALGLMLPSLTSMANETYVMGYPERWSNEPGQPANFYLSGAENPEAPLTIYDVSFRAVAEITAPLRRQEVASTIMQPWEDGYGWESQTIEIPDLPSGMYFMAGPDKATRALPFIINDPEEQADIVVIYPTNTVNAYSASPNVNNDPAYGERVNLYSAGTGGVRPHAMSFRRPMLDKVYQSQPFDRILLHDSPASYKYISDADLENYDAIAGAKMVVLPSHSEYWTENARRNFDRFVDQGGSALVLTGNAMYRAVEFDDAEAPTQMSFWPRIQYTSPRLDYPIWESIGADFLNGGYGPEFANARELINMPYGGYKMLDVSPSYLDGTGLEEGDILRNHAREYDGVPFVEVDPVTGPVVDHELLGFHRLDIIGFENTRIEGRDTAGTWIDFQKTEDSGRVINVGEAHWSLFLGEDALLRKQITRNMLDVLLIAQADFDGDESLTVSDLEQLISQVQNPDGRRRFDLTDDGIVASDDVARWLHDFAGTDYGDADLDGVIDLSDFMKLASSYEQSGDWSDGDFDSNGYVDFNDFMMLASSMAAQPSVAAVPEPTGLHLLVVGIAVLLQFRRRP